MCPAYFCGRSVGPRNDGGIARYGERSLGRSCAGRQGIATTSTLVGTKEIETDGSGYYRFAQPAPGNYTITVTAAGFATSKREVAIEVGHFAQCGYCAEVGKTSTIVEVSGQAPQIDVTTNRHDDEHNGRCHHGYPPREILPISHPVCSLSAKRALMNEIQRGRYSGNGTGGSSRAGTANGGNFGFSVAGGSDSENSYLVEGQETANLIGGYSHTSVPFDFIDQVEIRLRDLEAVWRPPWAAWST